MILHGGDPANLCSPSIGCRSNFLERIGVEYERDAWTASRDATGQPISGEMEVRLWASLRGQTLARAVLGVCQYGAAIRLLSWNQLEIEYALLEQAKPPEEQAPPETIQEDAAAASAWFTAERFAFVVAAQKYADHAKEDLEKRAQIDYLMATNPLLKIVHFAGGTSAITGQRQVYSVCRDWRGEQFRIVIPGE